MCLNPLILKNGNVVPCGKCMICLSNKRNEWSVRAQFHCEQYERMPFFCRFSYNEENLPFDETNGDECLRKKDIQDFLMRFRVNHSLVNTSFSYFGCGEYGDQGRPHYHLLLFGCDFLYPIYERSIHEAERILADDWKLGFVDCQVARSYGAIHYMTKYTIKLDDAGHSVKPFTLASKGIGKNWFDSKECQDIRAKLNPEYLREVMCDLPSLYVGTDDLRESLANIDLILKRLESVENLFQVTLPSGMKVAMPRYYRKALLGSFEQFKDNPLWYVNYLRQLRKEISDLISDQDYNATHETSLRHERLVARERRLRKLIFNKSINV